MATKKELKKNYEKSEEEEKKGEKYHLNNNRHNVASAAELIIQNIMANLLWLAAQTTRNISNVIIVQPYLKTRINSLSKKRLKKTDDYLNYLKPLKNPGATFLAKNATNFTLKIAQKTVRFFIPLALFSFPFNVIIN